MPALLATCWTTAGNAVPLPGRDTSPVRLADRVAAASGAGFVGFGLMHADLIEYLRTDDLRSLARTFRQYGVEYVELEFLTDWWEEGGPKRDASDRVLGLLLRSCEVLQPHHVKIGPDITGGPYDVDQWAEQFHRVCSAFSQVGTPVALEFMPFSNIRDLGSGIDLVRRAGHPNGGLMLDLWHIERGGVSLSEVAALDPDIVKGVELDDGDAQQVGDGYSDTINRRRLCGEGAFRVTDFITALQGLGWRGPWGVEILSEEYRTRPVASGVRDAYRTAMNAFEAAAQGSARNLA